MKIKNDELEDIKLCIREKNRFRSFLIKKNIEGQDRQNPCNIWYQKTDKRLTESKVS